MEVIVTIVSKLGDFTDLRDVSNLPYYRGYNPFTKYHGHPSNVYPGKQPLRCVKLTLNLRGP